MEKYIYFQLMHSIETYLFYNFVDDLDMGVAEKALRLSIFDL